MRLQEEDELWLRGHGLKPGTFARQAVHEAIRRLQIQEARTFLDGHTVRIEAPSQEWIRADRDRP